MADQLPDIVSDPRAISARGWVGRSPTFGGKVQRGEILDALLGAQPRTDIAALAQISHSAARAAHARDSIRSGFPIKSEALAHFAGGFAADERSDIVTRLKNGVKDLNYAKSISPAVRNDFYSKLLYAGLLGAGSIMAAKAWKRAGEKTAAARLSEMELRQLIRQLKMVRGTRANPRLLRILEARYAAMEKAKAAKESTK